MLGPEVSGPKHQIFKVSYLSQPNSSANLLLLSFSSSFGPMLPFSISSGNLSYNGKALQNNLLCLLGDLDKHIIFDSAVTVSL